MVYRQSVQGNVKEEAKQGGIASVIETLKARSIRSESQPHVVTPSVKEVLGRSVRSMSPVRTC
jgi:hypothetical protein